MLWFAGPEGALMTRLMRCPQEHPSRLWADLPHQTRQLGPSRVAALQIPQLGFSLFGVFPHPSPLFYSFFFLLLSLHSLCLPVEIPKLLVFNLASCWPDSGQRVPWDSVLFCVEEKEERKREKERKDAVERKREKDSWLREVPSEPIKFPSCRLWWQRWSYLGDSECGT